MATGLSRKKKLAFTAVLIGALFGIAEASARIAGLGDPDGLNESPLSAQWLYPPLFRPTLDRSGYRPTEPRIADRFFPRRSDDNAGPMRIFVFGESAVAGCGFSENGSFPRALERRLQDSGYNEVSVVNCGVRAISSPQVHLVERQVLKLLRKEGVHTTRDVFVFYVGNNEYLPINAERYRERFHEALPLSVKIDRWFNRSCLYTALKGASRRLRDVTPTLRSAGWPGSEAAIEPILRAEDIERGIQTHIAQLRAMIAEARDAGVQPVLMTVVTNNEWAALEEPAQGWIAQLCDGSSDASQRQQRLAEAERESTAAMARPGSTQIERWRHRIRRAQIRRALGRLPEARADFLAAYGEDDPYHLRCLPRMNENVRRLASESNVPLADAELSVLGVSTDHVTGYQFLYDQVHLNTQGAELVAEELHRTLAAARVVPALTGDPAAFLAKRNSLTVAQRDSLSLHDWLGWNDDRSFFTNRAFDRYEKARAALDEKISKKQATAEELVWAANGYALEVGGDPRARALYAEARALAPALGPVIDENVHTLDSRPK